MKRVPLQENVKRPNIVRQAERLILQSGKLTSTDKRVAGLLLMRHNKKTGRCDPSIRSMVRDLEISERSAHRAIANLTNSGDPNRLFDRVTHGGNHQCNAYRLRSEQVALEYAALAKRIYEREQQTACQGWQMDDARTGRSAVPNVAAKPHDKNVRNEPAGKVRGREARRSCVSGASRHPGFAVYRQVPRIQAQRAAADRRLTQDIAGHPHREALWGGHPDDWARAAEAEARMRGAGVELYANLTQLRRLQEAGDDAPRLTQTDGKPVGEIDAEA